MITNKEQGYGQVIRGQPGLLCRLPAPATFPGQQRPTGSYQHLQVGHVMGQDKSNIVVVRSIYNTMTGMCELLNLSIYAAL